MSKTLDFSIRKKQHLTVVLPDENNTTLLVTMPNKKLFDEIMASQQLLTKANQEELDNSSIDELYGLCSKILSRNKANIQVDVKLLEDNFDFEDVVVLFQSYVGFISEVTSTKN